MTVETEIQIDTDIEEMCQDIVKKAKVYKLILFNDDHHSMDEVAYQIIKAVKCDAKKAMRIMFEAHSKGKALAMSGSLDACKKAEAILMQIDLRTEIEEA